MRNGEEVRETIPKRGSMELSGCLLVGIGALGTFEILSKLTPERSVPWERIRQKVRLPEGEVVRLDSGRDRDGEQPTTKRTRSDQLVEPRFAGYDHGSRRFAIDTHPYGPLPPEHQVDVLGLEPEQQGGTITRRRSL